MTEFYNRRGRLVSDRPAKTDRATVVLTIITLTLWAAVINSAVGQWLGV